ncbi:MAG: flavodoxin family protein [Thermodesulfobacteriota bacterium]|nr:flavodoxin family protein [Thermodesulfobacteriota bacterium]
MKIVCLLASPRPKGNSATIAGWVCDEAEARGAEVQVFELNKMNYRGCQACMACKTNADRCVLEDDLTGVLDAVREADAVVVATPVYFGDVTAQLKGFIDRTYSYFVPDFLTTPTPSRLKPGKRLVFIQAQAQPDEQLFADIYPKYGLFFKFNGFQDNILIRACGVQAPDDAAAKPALQEQAKQAAGAIMGG